MCRNIKDSSLGREKRVRAGDGRESQRRGMQSLTSDPGGQCKDFGLFSI